MVFFRIDDRLPHKRGGCPFPEQTLPNSLPQTAANHATSRSDTANGAIRDEAASRSCSVASRTGAASQLATTAVLPSFSATSLAAIDLFGL